MYIPGPVQAFRGWFNNTKQAIANDGFAGTTRSGRHLIYGSVGRGLQAGGRKINFGDTVFKSEWDLLIILDGCRYDLFTNVCNEYPSVDSVEPAFSSTSSSDEWIEKNFDKNL